MSGAECPSQVPVALQASGRLSLEALKVHDMEYYRAVTEGITYHVVDEEVLKRFPTFSTLCQTAENAKTQAYK